MKFVTFFFVGTLLASCATSSIATKRIPASDIDSACEESELCKNLVSAGLSPRAYQLMMEKMNHTKYSKDFVAIADYTLPSDRERFFLINVKASTFKTFHVSHGSRSGGLEAVLFSNIPHEAHSALGFMKTTPSGSTFGESLIMSGLSSSNTRLNTDWPQILIHCAQYSSDHFLKKNGFWGRSFGCLAVPCEDIHEIVVALGSGALVLSYHDALWDEAQKNPRIQKIPGALPFPETTTWEYNENMNGNAGRPYGR